MSERQAGRPPLLVIVGPTAVGKSAVAIHLAERFGGEIVSADSRAIYRGMDIGTAKPTPAERGAIPHALIDIVAPDEPFGLAQFQELANAAIAGAQARGRLPLLVGGTGQYVHAVVEGWGIPEVPPQPALRERLSAEAQAEGGESLHRRLAAVDPEAAARIDPRNVRRVIRALEVYEVTGVPISEQQRKHPPGWDILQVGLRMERTRLYARVDARVDAMVAAGLLDELRALRAAGYPDDLPALSSLGYGELLPVLRGERTLEEGAALIKRNTRRFVRQQAVWFRADDPAIEWFDVDDRAAITERVQSWLRAREAMDDRSRKV